MPKFGKASLQRREMLCKDLRTLVDEVIKVYDFSIICSHRGQEEQERAFNNGTSKAHFGQSAHNYFPSFAADLYPYPVPYKQVKGVKQIDDNSPEWEKMICTFKNAAKRLGIKITCGIDFKNFRDCPHIEISDWKQKIKEI